VRGGFYDTESALSQRPWLRGQRLRHGVGLRGTKTKQRSAVSTVTGFLHDQKSGGDGGVGSRLLGRTGGHDGLGGVKGIAMRGRKKWAKWTERFVASPLWSVSWRKPVFSSLEKHSGYTGARPEIISRELFGTPPHTNSGVVRENS